MKKFEAPEMEVLEIVDVVSNEIPSLAEPEGEL